MMSFKQHYGLHQEGFKQKLGALGLAASMAFNAAAAPKPTAQSQQPQSISRQAGATKVTADSMFAQIAKHEGIRNKMYKDSEGVPTIGIGFNLIDKANRQFLARLNIAKDALVNGITDQQVRQLYKFSFDRALKDAKTFCPNFDTQPVNVQKALVDMSFNLGLPRLSGFVEFKKALLQKDYKKAADEMLDSKWARQTGNRATFLASLVRSSSS